MKEYHSIFDSEYPDNAEILRKFINYIKNNYSTISITYMMCITCIFIQKCFLNPIFWTTIFYTLLLMIHVSIYKIFVIELIFLISVFLLDILYSKNKSIFMQLLYLSNVFMENSIQRAYRKVPNKYITIYAIIIFWILLAGEIFLIYKLTQWFGGNIYPIYLLDINRELLLIKINNSLYLCTAIIQSAIFEIIRNILNIVIYKNFKIN